MRYGITFLEGQYKELQEHLFEGATTERAAYMLCGVVAAGEETRLLVREIHPLGADEVESATPSSMSILSWSYVRQLKRADERSAALVFVHSHPEGHAGFSRADDENERALFATAHIRVASVKVHASLVFAGPDKPFGRVWLDGGATCAVETIRVVGERFSFLRASQDDGETSVADRPLEDFAVFDRQARAFGGGLQPTLSALKVGIVGAGGTGSSVAEQLIRLGVGHLVVIDEQTFDKSNINRVYGSRLTDQGAPKVDLMSRLAADIGLGTVVETHHGSIVRPSVFRHLLDLDVVFGCTDGEWARSYLERLPTWYYVPVVDMGVMIDAPGGRLRSIQGRVTILQPGTACLSCRGRIEPARVRAESLSFTDPDEANKLRKEGYLEGLEEPAPSVVPFTTTIAATAVSELLHRITGFLGGERETSEVLQLFDSQRVRTNNRAGIRGCICTRRDRWGYGDRSLMMGMTWVEE